MLAAYYDGLDGPEVLQVGPVPTPEPDPGEVRIHVHVSAINPSDCKRRAGWDGAAIPRSRVVPHNDGAGMIDMVEPGVAAERVGGGSGYTKPRSTTRSALLPGSWSCPVLARSSCRTAWDTNSAPAWVSLQ
jgi:NADPH:quinone reductase-like Zn-dependent oxidoreductase